MLWVFLTCSLIWQLQATVLGLLASLMATVLGWMAEGQMPLHHIMLLCSASVSTTFFASLLQGNNTICRTIETPSQSICSNLLCFTLDLNQFSSMIHTLYNDRCWSMKSIVSCVLVQRLERTAPSQEIDYLSWKELLFMMDIMLRMGE